MKYAVLKISRDPETKMFKTILIFGLWHGALIRPNQYKQSITAARYAVKELWSCGMRTVWTVEVTDVRGRHRRVWRQWVAGAQMGKPTTEWHDGPSSGE